MSYAKSEATQKKLVESTARLLRTKGYGATGLSEIVRESGVPKGSLYHHFPGGKDELAAASVAHSGRGIIGAIAQLADDAGEPVAAIRAFCDYYVRQLESSDFKKGCPLATVTLEKSADVESVHNACSDAFGGIVELLTDRIAREGVDQQSAHEAALFTVSSIEGALMLAKARRDLEPVRVIRDRLTDHLRDIIKRGNEGSS